MNTPQFSWVRSRLPRKPQPVPPIYQPEIGAEAIFYAAHHARREMYVGYPTVGAIVTDKMVPALMDQYLARNGYESQQTDEFAETEREYNLWQPVAGDHGAHGNFDDRARSSSPQLWLNMNRDWLVAAGGALAGLALAFLLNHNAQKKQRELIER